MKFAKVVSRLAERCGISEQEALDVFYKSLTYNYLSNLKGNLHNMGVDYIVDEILLEMNARNEADGFLQL